MCGSTDVTSHDCVLQDHHLPCAQGGRSNLPCVLYLFCCRFARSAATMSYCRELALVWVALMALVCYHVQAYSSGPPATSGVCNNMMPSHRGQSGSANPGYTLTPSTSAYVVGQSYRRESNKLVCALYLTARWTLGLLFSLYFHIKSRTQHPWTNSLSALANVKREVGDYWGLWFSFKLPLLMNFSEKVRALKVRRAKSSVHLRSENPWESRILHEGIVSPPAREFRCIKCWALLMSSHWSWMLLGGGCCVRTSQY